MFSVVTALVLLFFAVLILAGPPLERLLDWLFMPRRKDRSGPSKTR